MSQATARGGLSKRLLGGFGAGNSGGGEGEEFLYGVNLGGWLVLERWMTPGLFEGTDAPDELSFMQTPGAVTKLRDHQKNFIREEDWRWMRNNGVNAVRIPVGYWIFDGDGPLRSAIGRLDWAVRMAAKYDIKVLICLHAAMGSQNGQQHSGKLGKAEWHSNPHYRKQTVDCLRRLAGRYHGQESVWGIELLNEPKRGFLQPVLRRFYRQAYEAVAMAGQPGLRVVFHDAFSPRVLSGALRAYRRNPVVMDHHWYHFFIARPVQHLVPFGVYYWYLRHIKAPMLRSLSRAQPIVIGEWNGIIGGEKLNRYPREQHNEIVAEHLRVQLGVYQATTAGWFYWSYKTDDRGVFHFRSLVEDGVITLPNLQK